MGDDVKKQGIMARLIRDHVPTNVRLFGEYMLGADSPITEEDFTEKELQYLRSQIIRKMAENDQLEQEYRRAQEEAHRLDSGAMADAKWDESKGEWVSEVPDYSDVIRSFEASRGRTSIGYSDYGIDHSADGGSTLLRSLSDPEYRMVTSLGAYTAHDKDGNLVIKDNYDWGAHDYDDLSFADLIKALPHAKNAREIGDLLAMTFRNQSGGRPVEINLGKREERRQE